jgi:hypothetical protein
MMGALAPTSRHQQVGTSSGSSFWNFSGERSTGSSTPSKIKLCGWNGFVVVIFRAVIFHRILAILIVQKAIPTIYERLVEVFCKDN